MWSTQIAPVWSQVTQTRARASLHLRTLQVPEPALEDVLMMVSELVTNAIRYGGEPLALRIDATDRHVRVEVDDGSHVVPILLPIDLSRDGGMGIRIVDHLSDSWGTCSTEAGKTVWFELDVPAV